MTLPAKQKKRMAYSFVPLLVFAASIHLLAAVVNEGLYPAEEQYRYPELASRASGLGESHELPAELHERTLPGLLPLFGHTVVRAAASLGIASPFLQSTVLRILSSLMGMLGSLMMFSVFRGECSSHIARRWLFVLLFLLWFFPFLQARFSAENWSGILFFLGLAWYYQKGEQGDVSIMIAGFLMGLSFFTRFQMAAMIAGLVGWLLFIERADRRVFLSLIGGAAIAGTLGMLADRFFYGSWTFTPWNSLVYAVSEEGSGYLSVTGHPWWYTIGEAIQRGFYPLGFIIVVSTLLFIAHARRHILTWVALPCLVLHFLTSPGQFRDLFPLLLAVPVMVVLISQAMLEAIPNGEWRHKTAAAIRWTGYPLLAINLVLALGASMLPADEYAPLYRFVYDRYGGGKTLLAHTGKDPYERPGIPMDLYTPAQLKRFHVGDETQLRAIVEEKPGVKIILASGTELLPAHFSTDELEYRQVYQSVPEWSSLANQWGWFHNADTIVLYEVQSTHRRVSVGSRAANGHGRGSPDRQHTAAHPGSLEAVPSSRPRR